MYKFILAIFLSYLLLFALSLPFIALQMSSSRWHKCQIKAFTVWKLLTPLPPSKYSSFCDNSFQWKFQVEIYSMQILLYYWSYSYCFTFKKFSLSWRYIPVKIRYGLVVLPFSRIFMTSPDFSFPTKSSIIFFIESGFIMLQLKSDEIKFSHRPIWTSVRKSSKL